MTKILSVRNLQETPAEVWLQWVVVDGATHPVIFKSEFVDYGDAESIRYVRDDLELQEKTMDDRTQAKALELARDYLDKKEVKYKAGDIGHVAKLILKALK